MKNKNSLKCFAVSDRRNHRNPVHKGYCSRKKKGIKPSVSEDRACLLKKAFQHIIIIIIIIQEPAQDTSFK